MLCVAGRPQAHAMSVYQPTWDRGSLNAPYLATEYCSMLKQEICSTYVNGTDRTASGYAPPRSRRSSLQSNASDMLSILYIQSFLLLFLLWPSVSHPSQSSIPPCPICCTSRAVPVPKALALCPVHSRASLHIKYKHHPTFGKFTFGIITSFNALGASFFPLLGSPPGWY